jgi:hypothetical protein
MDLSGNDLDSVTRTILAEAGENAMPASMAAVASVIIAMDVDQAADRGGGALTS